MNGLEKRQEPCEKNWSVDSPGRRIDVARLTRDTHGGQRKAASVWLAARAVRQLIHEVSNGWQRQIACRNCRLGLRDHSLRECALDAPWDRRRVSGDPGSWSKQIRGEVNKALGELQDGVFGDSSWTRGEEEFEGSIRRQKATAEVSRMRVRNRGDEVRRCEAGVQGCLRGMGV